MTKTSVRPTCVLHSSCDLQQCPFKKKKKGKKSTNSSVFVPEKHVQMVPSHLPLLSVQFFGRPLLLGLPQMAGDGDGVHTGGHGFGWDLAELLPV